MRASLISAVLLLSTGCIPNNSLGSETIAQTNIYRLHQISIGMTQEDVFQIMRYPAINEQIAFEDLCYEIWFYVTRMTILGQSELSCRNLTPLIFKDEILVAKGYDYYNHLLDQKKSYETYPSQKSRDQENLNLEKALQAPPSEQTPPTAKPPAASQPRALQKKNNTPSVAMSSKPAPTKKRSQSEPATKPEESETQQDQKEGYSWSEEDDRMQEQQQEQNFDYW